MKASIAKPEAGSVNLGSVLESLANKGFELSGEQRISYRNHDKALYVYVGKIAD